MILLPSIGLGKKRKKKSKRPNAKALIGQALDAHKTKSTLDPDHVVITGRLILKPDLYGNSTFMSAWALSRDSISRDLKSGIDKKSFRHTLIMSRDLRELQTHWSTRTGKAHFVPEADWHIHFKHNDHFAFSIHKKDLADLHLRYVSILTYYKKETYGDMPYVDKHYELCKIDRKIDGSSNDQVIYIGDIVCALEETGKKYTYVSTDIKDEFEAFKQSKFFKKRFNPEHQSLIKNHSLSSKNFSFDQAFLFKRIQAQKNAQL